jgi:hypothetical protein
MWDIAVGVISNAIWEAIKKLGLGTKNYATDWKGTIEDLNGEIFDNEIWDKPIIVQGTFSEYVPFVNFSKILPDNLQSKNMSNIGTCRLGDSIIDGKYIGAIHLPNETSGNSPAIPIFYSGSSKLCSPNFKTGDQIRLKCKITSLDNVSHIQEVAINTNDF